MWACTRGRVSNSMSYRFIYIRPWRGPKTRVAFSSRVQPADISKACIAAWLGVSCLLRNAAAYISAALRESRCPPQESLLPRDHAAGSGDRAVLVHTAWPAGRAWCCRCQTWPAGQHLSRSLSHSRFCLSVSLSLFFLTPHGGGVAMMMIGHPATLIMPASRRRRPRFSNLYRTWEFLISTFLFLCWSRAAQSVGIKRSLLTSTVAPTT
jgi:hypothetical protein